MFLWEKSLFLVHQKAQTFQRVQKFWLTLTKANLSKQPQVSLYRCFIESILTYGISVWYVGCSMADKKTLQRVIKSDQKIIGTQLPVLEDI